MTAQNLIIRIIRIISKLKPNFHRLPFGYGGLRRFLRRSFPLALAVIFLFGPAAYLLSRNPQKAGAAWFDDSWGYRKAISIPTHTSAENNVYVTVPTFDATDTTKFQADCGDLRFTKQNGELLLYYVVDCDATANIHVQFDTLPAGASTYYMYYGNPSAQNGFESADFATAASGLGTQTLASEEKSPGPVAYWGFDEGYGTTAQDKTLNNNDGSISGATWQTEDQCVSGKCLYFDGSNDVVTVSNTVSGIQTVSFWVKPITTSEQFIDLNGSAYIQASSGTISATGFTSPTIYVNGKVSSTLSANSWQYVTVTTGTAISGSAIKIGQISTNYGQAFFDEVKIYNYARSASQILTDFASRGSSKGVSLQSGQGDSLSNGLVGYWKMDESSWTVDCSTTSVTDSSGNANNGKSCPATTGPAGGAAGKFGNAGSFDGSDDYVDLGNGSSLTPASQLTLAGWVYFRTWSSVARRQAIISKFVDDVAETYVLGVNVFDAPLYRPVIMVSNEAGTGPISATGPTALQLNRWYHLAGTSDGTTVRLYLDGQLIASTVGVAIPKVSTETVKLSRISYGGVGYGNQIIDDVRIYNRALSPAEVSQLYNWAPGPAVSLKMDEGTGTSANDDSGNNRTGTLNDGPTWSTGKYGKGVKLDGTNDDISIGDFGY